MAPLLYVINSSGERELFSLRKVLRSARRVGASMPLAQKIAETIRREVYPGIKTSEIFRRIKELLTKEKPDSAIRFNIKEGMRKLGPTGFPFEKYIAEIFRKRGFMVNLNPHINGACCSSYELDFLAQKDNLLNVGECKYHNFPGGRVDLTIALANYARFLDIVNGTIFEGHNSKNVKMNPRLRRAFLNKKYWVRLGRSISLLHKKQCEVKSILVTNTKFTSEAIKYSRCVGVELLGWNYPRNRGLEHFIEEQKLYPITILPSFKRYLAAIFVKRQIMLAEDVLRLDISSLAREEKIPEERFKSLVKEVKILFHV